MTAIIRVIDRINLVSGIIAAWLMIPLIVSMCWEVVARYVFTAPTIWAYELAYILTGSSWMLGMAYTLSKGAHIRIDAVSARFSPQTKAAIDIVGYLFIVLPFIVWIVFALDDRVIASYSSGEKTGHSAWNPPIWPFRAVFLASFVLLALQIVAEILRGITVLKGRRDRRATAQGEVSP